MRKILWCSIITLLYLSTSLGQTPQALQYQAVARKSDGSLLANQPISVSFSILYKHAGGTALLYKETHQDTTNAFGLFNLQIGTGTPDSGSWYIVDWSLGNMFLKVEIDGGTGALDMGTTQLISVPYALYAEEAKLAVQSLSSLTSLDLTLPYTGSTSFDGPTFQVTNTEIDFTTAGIWGQVSSPKNGSGGLYGFATAAIGETYGVYGRTNSGSAFASGVRGHAQDPILPAVAQNTYGVHGTTNSRGDHAAGVLGEATTGIGAGATYGVQGTTFSFGDHAAGVLGEAAAGVGQTYGVHGRTSSTADLSSGLRGEAAAGAAAGKTYGVHGTTNSPKDESAGILGEALNGNGQTYGVYGRTFSKDGFATGVRGAATGLAIGPTYGVHGTTNSAIDLAAGVRGEATNQNGQIVYGVHGITDAVGLNTAGVRGEARLNDAQTTYGVHGTTNSKTDLSAGVLGEALRPDGEKTYGVHGLSYSVNEEGAGVVAEGNGANDVIKVPRAAALEIKNGAIRITGPKKPSGTVKADTWKLMLSGVTSSPQLEAHPHAIGAIDSIQIENDLITSESQIFVSLEGAPPYPGLSCYAQIIDKYAGHATVLVSVIGMIEPMLLPLPEYFGEVLIHYLIINTEAEGAKASSGN